MADFGQIPPAPDLSLATLNRVIDEINKNFVTLGRALAQIQNPKDHVALIEEATRGVVVKSIPDVPVVYDQRFYRNVVTTIADRINVLIDLLQQRKVIG